MIACALEKNEILQELNLNGNSLGPLGARSIMRSVRLIAATKRVLKVTFDNANLNFVAPDLFNRAEPSGDYDLDLSNPYDYTIIHLLYEMANAKGGSKFRNMMYLPSQSFSGKWRKVNLIRASNVPSIGSMYDLIPSIAKALEFYKQGGECTPILESIDSLCYILGFEPRKHRFSH